MRKRLHLILLTLVVSPIAYAQPGMKTFSHADTLRGSITSERAWWDVLRYDITVKPDYKSRTTKGRNVITYKVLSDHHLNKMQIDLQDPLKIDSIRYKQQTLEFEQRGNVWYVNTPVQRKDSKESIEVYFSGKPRLAPRPPWDGGWTFTKDSLGRPWMTVTCQGLGASVWYPCKDHQSDEPDEGASLSIIVPDTLVAVANGRLQSKKINGDGTTSYTWAVVSPINNYAIIPYIGKYVNFAEVYNGETGPLDVNYWVLDYNLETAKKYLPPEVHNMFRAFEYWFGPYPFYDDGYKLVDAPHPGMEHQSAVAYGNWYKPGYRGRDVSGTGWGMKWDFIVVHESAHEWFGNNITTKDLADMWVHEGFASYSESLFVEYIFGKNAANEDRLGVRKGIKNDRPIIADYNVNAEGSGDMYPKGATLLGLLRNSIDNDVLFREILRGLNRDFYHQTVTSRRIEDYISKKTGFNYSKVFDQYLRTTQIPKLEFFFDGDEVHYHWSNCVKGFDLPVVLEDGASKVRLMPVEQWKHTEVNEVQKKLFTNDTFIKAYYADLVPIEKNTK